MPSIFTKIIRGEIPCYKVAETEHYFAFLDILPLAKGHTLVIPKKETDYLFDMDGESYLGLFAFAKTVAAGIQQAIPCKKVGIAVIGLEVPHAHIHLVPLNQPADINFSNPKLQLTPEELSGIAESIREKITI